MYYKVFKALDKPSSLFGLRGSYLYFCVGGIAVAGVVALVIGSLGVKILSWLIFFVLAAAAYFVTLQVQSKLSEKERTKWFCSHRLPSCVQVPPRRFSSYVTVKFSKAQKPKGTK